MPFHCVIASVLPLLMPPSAADHPSVDAATDQLITSIIREHFANRTIIAIVHKLHTVLDFDRVMLLDQGRIVESGDPQELLKGDSQFRALYEASGQEQA